MAKNFDRMREVGLWWKWSLREGPLLKEACYILTHTNHVSFTFYSPAVLCVCLSWKILTRRLRFRLERAAGEHGLIDRSGRTLKMEPLTTIQALERYLLKMVGVLEEPKSQHNRISLETLKLWCTKCVNIENWDSNNNNSNWIATQCIETVT